MERAPEREKGASDFESIHVEHANQLTDSAQAGRRISNEEKTEKEKNGLTDIFLPVLSHGADNGFEYVHDDQSPTDTRSQDSSIKKPSEEKVHGERENGCFGSMLSNVVAAGNTTKDEPNKVLQKNQTENEKTSGDDDHEKSQTGSSDGLTDIFLPVLSHGADNGFECVHDDQRPTETRIQTSSINKPSEEKVHGERENGCFGSMLSNVVAAGNTTKDEPNKVLQKNRTENEKTSGDDDHEKSQTGSSDASISPDNDMFATTTTRNYHIGNTVPWSERDESVMKYQTEMINEVGSDQLRAAVNDDTGLPSLVLERDKRVLIFTCKKCFKRPAERILDSCFHFALCADCANKTDECPFTDCRQKFGATITATLGSYKIRL